MAEHMTVEEVKKHVKVYVMVFAALAVLTVVTVAVSYLDFTIVPALIVAMIIALVKGGLVAAYFMHLISEKKVIAWVLIVTVVFLVCMFILFISALSDQENVSMLYDVVGSYVA